MQIAQKQYSAAETSFETALAALEQISTTSNQLGAVMYVNLAEAYTFDGNYVQAETTYRKALNIAEKVLPSSYVLGYVLQGLGAMYASQNKYQEAEEPLERGRRILEQYFGSNHPDTAQIQALLATNEVHLGRESDARPLFDRSVKSLETTLGAHNPKLVEIWKSWARALGDSGKDKDAEEANSRAETIRAASKH